MVEDEEKFCRSMESAKDYLTKDNENNNIEDVDSYRLYSFVGQNVSLQSLSNSLDRPILHGNHKTL